MEPQDRRFEKGFFTRLRFAVATKYPRLTGGRRLFRIGAIAGALVLVPLAVDAVAGHSTLVAGPLSKNHALFGKECSACHTPLHGVRNGSCESCHESKSGGVRAFSLDRHYRYRSGEFDRSSPKRLELRCAECHSEHRGRENLLRAVADEKCTGSHTTGSFSRGHPEFEFARKQLQNPINLKFDHIRHLREVMDDRKLKDQDQEKACLACHVAQPDGRSFKPLSYATACDGCHLLADVKTPYLAVRAPGRPGVVSLAEIRRTGGPGTEWAEHLNPAEFLDQGGTIRKTRVYHADPWILENLKRLRRELYPTAELADLLHTSADLPPDKSRALYEEAIATLDNQITALRGNPSPDVKRELDAVQALLTEVRRRIDRPFEPLDETRFAVGDANRAAGVDERPYLAAVDSLTKPCQECHVVDHATIRRVQTDQRFLVRAEFDHKKHVIQAGCIDCHSVIPFRTFIGTTNKPSAAEDNATILNLPAIATCRSCHSNSTAPAQCTSCHLFHPDKSHLANLAR